MEALGVFGIFNRGVGGYKLFFLGVQSREATLLMLVFVADKVEIKKSKHYLYP